MSAKTLAVVVTALVTLAACGGDGLSAEDRELLEAARAVTTTASSTTTTTTSPATPTSTTTTTTSPATTTTVVLDPVIRWASDHGESWTLWVEITIDTASGISVDSPSSVLLACRAAIEDADRIAGLVSLAITSAPEPLSGYLQTAFLDGYNAYVNCANGDISAATPLLASSIEAQESVSQELRNASGG